VYRARDTKLDRDVAIKVLPELFVSDPERVARFQREAKTLASLNHPHIGGIYGLEDADGVRALVLELVEGRRCRSDRARTDLIRRADREASSIEIGPCAIRSASVGLPPAPAPTRVRHRRLRGRRCRRCGMIQRGQRFRFALKARDPLGIGDEQLGQDLDRDIAIELRVAARYTSPIPPAPSATTISYGPSFIPAVSMRIAEPSSRASCRTRQPGSRAVWESRDYTGESEGRSGNLSSERRGSSRQSARLGTGGR